MEEAPEYSKEVARGSFWNLAGNVFFKLISFAYVVILARAASQDDIGLFYLSLSIISLIGVVSDLGLPSALQRYVPYYEGKGRREEISRLLSFCTKAVLALSILFAAAAFLLADAIGELYQNPGLPGALRLLSVFIIFQNLFRISSYLLQGFGDMKSMQLMMNAQNLSKLILTLVFFQAFGPTAASISAAFSISHLLAVAVSYPRILGLTRGLPKASGGEPGSFLRDLIPFSVTIALINSTWVIVSSSDRAMLGYLMPAGSATGFVAVYSIASTLASVLLVLPGSIELVFLPILSRFVGLGERAKIREMTEDSVRWALLLTLPGAIALGFLSGELLSAFYGPSFSSGSLAMAILVAGIAVKSATVMLFLALAAMRLVRIELQASLLSAAANIVANIILIPRFGMAGAAAGTAFSFVVLSVLLIYHSRKAFGFRIRAEYLRILLAGLAASAILWALRPALLPPGAEDLMAVDEPLIKAAAFAYLGVLAALSASLFGLLAIALRCYSVHDVSLLEKGLAKLRVPPPFAIAALKIASYGAYDRK